MNATPAIHYPAELPVTQRRAEILDALRQHQVIILAGETGSGKTTQLPKMCLEAGFAERGQIGCTQPRRVAAMSVSQRVAEELQVQWGREVGCKIRFNDDTQRETKVKFMTDGILLAEIQSDPLLRRYSALILDEAHERSLNIDFLLGYLQGLLKKRPDLKLLITSATIDTEAFSQAFGGAPIIQVSGRLYPVEVRYTPLEDFGDEDLHYVEAAARAAEDALIETENGDVLVFLPTERDIREGKEILEGRLGEAFEILGLYGRLPAGEQRKIFSPGPKRRVVLATNVAETSLTIPRIVAVVDTGLARISRYNPRTRTKRLPIEPISQSSANQRAGRAGRLSEGLCIRLYSQEDFEKRPPFTQPEIQRSNLAEVILRMKAFRLGEVETFPFINPPQAQAIRGGYQLLHELGALEEQDGADLREWNLTPLGRELARLPIDPTLGRMLLHAREEGVLPEMLVVAAGLSIPDPRERPDDQKEAANAAHRLFHHPESDFITLLNLWDAAPPLEGGPIRTSRNALRRFCKSHFLSLTRMREWRDLYRQLEEAMRGTRPPRHGKSQSTAPKNFHVPKEEAEQAKRDALHRSILTGLLSHIGQRVERNQYKASGNRVVTLFPGSGLYVRQPKKGEGKQPEWIMAGEIVQTSQLFARMVAKISPEWVAELGAHLCRCRYSHPQWSQKAGRVLVWERVLLNGLELTKRQVDFGKIEPEIAKELFIRGALVAPEAEEEEGTGGPRRPRNLRITHRFFEENRALRDRIETALTKVRSSRLHDLDEAFYQFYAERLPTLSSYHDLDRFMRDEKNRDRLIAKESDIIKELPDAREAFPDQVAFENTVLPLSYAYNPGEEKDGVTVRVPLPLADRLTTGRLHWMVPGLREEQISELLRTLPKVWRKPLSPLDPKIKEIVAEFDPGDGDLYAALSAFIEKKYHLAIPQEAWRPLPDYLRPRIQIINQKNRAIATGRDLSALIEKVDQSDLPSRAWDRVARLWERTGLTSWPTSLPAPHEDLPESIVVEEIQGAPLLAYPGLALEKEGVALRLFRKPGDVLEAAPKALRRLAEIVHAKEIQWLLKEFRVLEKPLPTAKKQVASFGDVFASLEKAPPGERLAVTPESACAHVVRHLFRIENPLPLSRKRFETMLEEARRAIPLTARKVIDLTRQLLETREQLRTGKQHYPGMEKDLDRLLPPNFLEITPHDQLGHLPRYLKAIALRAERATVNPAKDADKAKQLLPFANWESRVAPEKREEYRWMLEEFRVSLFAQELGTRYPVSAQRLRALEN